MNTEREELAKVIVSAYGENADTDCPCEQDMDLADAILAAGYRKPRTITERFEDNGPDELAPLSVVLSAGKPAIMQHDGTFMDYDGISWDAWEMDYPLTVIHEPEATRPTNAEATNIDYAMATAAAAGVPLTEAQVREYIAPDAGPEAEATR